jgi:hypothetical protein
VRPAVLLLLVDGLPASKLPGAAPLECYVGFRGVEASLFTGTETSVHGIWTDYRRGPASPYAWLRRIPGLVPTYHALPRGGQRLLGVVVHQWTRVATMNAALPKSSLIPFDILAEMEFASARLPWAHGAYGALPSLFDHLRLHGRSFVCLAPPSVSAWRTTDDKVTKALRESLKRGRRDFYYVKLVDLDRASHRYGPDSDVARQVLRRTLSTVDELATLMRERLGEVRAVVLSDHGFLPVERHVDVAGRLQEWRRRFNDFVYFLDSTLVRCWCHTDASRHRLMSYLGDEAGLTRLDDQLLQRYGLDQLPGAYGDITYVAGHGWVVWPDFFWATPPLGMHGYLPHPSLEAGLRIDGFETEQRRYGFADLMRLLLGMLEVEIT